MYKVGLNIVDMDYNKLNCYNKTGGNDDMSINTELTQIPGIGKKMAEHLAGIGYPDIESLKGQDPEEIYRKHLLRHGAGNMSCKCVLYCYRLAVCYANNDGVLPPDKQNWNDWKD